MKRIGILTYHCIPNFGAQLQTLSTIGFLKDNGFQPIVLNWYPTDLKEFYEKRVSLEQNKIQFDFSQENMPVSTLCSDLHELCKEIERLNLDAVILGSDALFDYTPEKFRYNFSLRNLRRIPIHITSNHLLPNPFWGSFNDYLSKKIPLFGYAISSQNMPYRSLNSKERKEMNRLLNGFKKITVRDEWTKKMVIKIGGINNVEIVPDPVFAFNQNYTKIPAKHDIIKKYKLPEDYILISFIYPNLTDEYVNNIIHGIKLRTGVECVSFPMPDRLREFDTNYTIKLPLNPIDWYALIKYSKGYIGERMHPIVVCLHNSIPFFCFDQYGTRKKIIPRIWSKFIPESSKIYDILHKANLQNYSCFYHNTTDISPDLIIDLINHFPKETCNQFSDNQRLKYNEAISSLLTEIYE